jgi:ATP synthase F1 gamma subunit
MRNKQQLQLEMELVSTLKMISQVYEEISVMKMQKVRDWVLKTREYLNQMSDVYFDVKSSYKQKFIDKLLLKKDKSENFYNINRNGKTIAVLLSANSKMNGDILKKVFRKFKKYVEQHKDADVAIVGKVGKTMFDEQLPGRSYQQFYMSEQKIDLESIRRLISYIIRYKEAVMFYGEFETLLDQKAVFNDVLGNEPTEEKQKEAEKQNKGFIFEPSIDKILEFFETQYFSSMVKQTMYESELARYASRITAMEQAIQHIKDTEKDLHREQRKLHQSKMNKMQSNNLIRLMCVKN